MSMNILERASKWAHFSLYDSRNLYNLCIACCLCPISPQKLPSYYTSAKPTLLNTPLEADVQVEQVALT